MSIRNMLFSLTWRKKLCPSCANLLCVSNFSPCYTCTKGCNYEYDQGGQNMEKDEIVAEKITVHYSDGSTVELEKGLVFHIKEEGDQAHITADLVAMGGRDLYTVVEAAIELGRRLGMFDGLGGVTSDGQGKGDKKAPQKPAPGKAPDVRPRHV